jgi:hypothetical protein
MWTLVPECLFPAGQVKHPPQGANVDSHPQKRWNYWAYMVHSHSNMQRNAHYRYIRGFVSPCNRAMSGFKVCLCTNKILF